MTRVEQHAHARHWVFRALDRLIEQRRSDARPIEPRHREAVQEPKPKDHSPSAVPPEMKPAGALERMRPEPEPSAVAGPGPEPDYLPDGPTSPMPHYWPAEPETK